MRRAASASMGRPVRNSSRVAGAPITRTNRRMPGAAYTHPRRAGGMPSRAPRVASRQSAAMAISSAPPNALPLSAAITGTGQSSTAPAARPSSRSPVRTASVRAAPSRACRSTPPEKLRSPAPVSTTARAPSSASADSAVTSASSIGSSRLLARDSFVMVTTATHPSRTVSIRPALTGCAPGGPAWPRSPGPGPPAAPSGSRPPASPPRGGPPPW